MTIFGLCFILYFFKWFFYSLQQWRYHRLSGRGLILQFVLPGAGADAGAGGGTQILSINRYDFASGILLHKMGSFSFA